MARSHFDCVHNSADGDFRQPITANLTTRRHHNDRHKTGYVDMRSLIREMNRPIAAFAGEANCLGLDANMFFPERGDSTREAKRVCAGCKVRAECLAYALKHGERCGIWGGKSERERRLMRYEIKHGEPKSV